MDHIYSLGLLLNRASVAISKTATSRLSQMGYDLPHSQFMVLRTLHLKGALSQYELANILCKNAAAIKRTVDNLQEKGLVKRHRLSAKKFAIIITEKGKDIIPKANAVVDSIMEQALIGIAPEVRDTLFNTLDNIYNNLDNLKLYLPRV